MTRTLLYLLGLPLLCCLAALPARAADALERQPDWPALQQRYQSDHFIILHDHEDEWVGFLAEILEDAYMDYFRYMELAGMKVAPPEEPLVWFCFASHDAYRAHSMRVDRIDLGRLPGYYSTYSNSVAIHHGGKHAARSTETMLEIARHEVMHQLAFNSGLQRRGVAYPLWAAEGLAMLLEGPVSSQPALAAEHGARRDGLLRAHRAGTLMPLRELVAMMHVCKDAHSRQAQQAYNQYWGFFVFCLQERPQQLRRYLTAMLGVRDGYPDQALLENTFADAFGNLQTLENEWRAFVTALDLHVHHLRIVQAAAEQP